MLLRNFQNFAKLKLKPSLIYSERMFKDLPQSHTAMVFARPLSQIQKT
jgi:hypothetical protein